MFQEHDRIVAANRRAQQPRGVHGRRRVRDPNPRTVRKDALARLAVIRPAAAQVAADRHADDHRTRELVARAIPQHRHLVAELHHRRPDVVEELDLDDRLQLARRHADAAADDRRFGERRVEDAIVAVQALQPVRDLEDAAFAGDDVQNLRAAGVGDVFAEHDDARIARHLVLERAIDRADHRVGLAVRRGGGVERRRRRIHVRRIDPEPGRVFRRLRRLQREGGGVVQLAVDLGGNRGQVSRRSRGRW